MDSRLLISFLLILGLTVIKGQHENIPYQDVENICETCICLTALDADNQVHYVMSCIKKDFSHILARWPTKFGKNHNGVEIVASFSGNHIDVLQQLPASPANISFTCRHCSIQHIQAPAFMDVPNIQRLDLSYNLISSEDLTPDVFRGPFKAPEYQPIALTELDLSHNKINSLNKAVFVHVPKLRKLNLGYNAFQIFDQSTTLALNSLSSLEELNLEYVGISQLPESLMANWPNLKTLNLAGNQFKQMPSQLPLVGHSLQALNMAHNPFSVLSQQSFLGLKSLKYLNISDSSLSQIEANAFALMETLETVDCSHNHQLTQFDLKGLLHSSNMTYLDISLSNLKSLSLDMDLSQIVGPNRTKIPGKWPLPWPKLHTFHIMGNPWYCDCELFETLEYMGSHHRSAESQVRCDGPYILAGDLFSNLTSNDVCSLQIPKKYRIIDDDPPRFLRKRYIILTLIAASVVIIVGLLIGFIVAFIRRRLKRDDFGVEPIRYTSVRSSNLSAFSNSHANGHGNGNLV